MQTMKMKRLRRWETALLAAVCVALLTGVRAGAVQRDLAEKVIRLHVIAVSDSPEDQAVKLQVRDAVLAYLEPALEGVADVREAEEVLKQLLPELEELARGTSGESQVAATLDREVYPPREYDTFSLPAGEYVSLRIVLGEGAGQNWWCVVYPPLCTQSITREEAVSALSEDQVRLIEQEGEGAEIRFRLVELWGSLLARWK